MVNASEVLLVIDSGAYYLFKDLYEVSGINKYMIETPTEMLLSIAYKIHTNKQIAKHI